MALAKTCGLEFRAMATDDTNELHLEQVDPPHPMEAVIRPAIIAFVVAAVFISAYLWFNRTIPIFSGSVTRVSAAPLPIQRVNDEGTALPIAVEDQLLVFAQLHIQNLSDKTLTIQEISAILQSNPETPATPATPAAPGTPATPTPGRRSVAAAKIDFDKVFQMYPQFAGFKGDPLLNDTKIAPHQSVDGLVIFDYPITQQQWDLRRGLSVYVDFTNNTQLPLQAQ
jgi:hypothetical protein